MARRVSTGAVDYRSLAVVVDSCIVDGCTQVWAARRQEAEFRSVEAARRVDLAREETAQINIRAQEAISRSTLESDLRQIAQLQLAKSQNDVLIESERHAQAAANVEAESVKVRECVGGCVRYEVGRPCRGCVPALRDRPSQRAYRPAATSGKVQQGYFGCVSAVGAAEAGCRNHAQ